MIYFLALLPATILTIAGYGVLYLAQRSEGTLKSFGKYLGFWAFTLAALVVLGSIFAAARSPGMHGMHGMMMHGYADEEHMRQCHDMHSWRRPAPGAQPRRRARHRPMRPRRPLQSRAPRRNSAHPSAHLVGVKSALTSKDVHRGRNLPGDRC